MHCLICCWHTIIHWLDELEYELNGADLLSFVHSLAAFVGMLDYIWYSHPALRPISVSTRIIPL
jgi:hypothetical protein